MQVQLVNSIKAPRSPKWLRNQNVFFVFRGEEVWWTTGTMMVRGTPPADVFLMDHIEHEAADWGPTGLPVQIVPRYLLVHGITEFADKDGGTATLLDAEMVEYIEDLSQFPIVWMRYPDGEDGFPQAVVAFERVLDLAMPSTTEGGLPAIRELRPLAFLSAVSTRHNLYLSPQEIDMVPPMSGIKKVGMVER